MHGQEIFLISLISSFFFSLLFSDERWERNRAGKFALSNQRQILSMAAKPKRRQCLPLGVVALSFSPDIPYSHAIPRVHELRRITNRAIFILGSFLSKFSAASSPLLHFFYLFIYLFWRSKIGRFSIFVKKKYFRRKVRQKIYKRGLDLGYRVPLWFGVSWLPKPTSHGIRRTPLSKTALEIEGKKTEVLGDSQGENKDYPSGSFSWNPHVGSPSSE